MFRDEQYPMLRQDQADALRQFAEQNNVPAEHVTVMAGVTGRGYQPPTDVDGWRTMHELLSKTGAFHIPGEVEEHFPGVIGG